MSLKIEGLLKQSECNKCHGAEANVHTMPHMLKHETHSFAKESISTHLDAIATADVTCNATKLHGSTRLAFVLCWSPAVGAEVANAMFQTRIFGFLCHVM